MTSCPHRCLEIWPGFNNPRNSEGSFAELKDGRLLFVYSHFYGNSDDDNSSAVLAARYSSDKGETWTAMDRIIVGKEAVMNVMSVSLLRLQDGRLALFYGRKNSNYDSRPVVRFSEDDGESWSEAVSCLNEPIGYYVLNNDRVIQLKEGPHKGRIIVPLARHSLLSEAPEGIDVLAPAAELWSRPDVGIDFHGRIVCALSDDGAKTWRLSQDSFEVFDSNGNRTVAQEPGVVELRNGKILMYIRSEGGQYFCTSEDGGDTWSKPYMSPLHSPISPASMKRLPNGDLLALWNNYDAVPGGTLDGLRTPLATAVSSDEGITWNHVKLLEGNLKGWYCYIGIHVMADDVLLSYNAMDYLNHQRITNVPIEYLYAPGPEALYELTGDNGAFTFNSYFPD